MICSLPRLQIPFPPRGVGIASWFLPKDCHLISIRNRLDPCNSKTDTSSSTQTSTKEIDHTSTYSFTDQVDASIRRILRISSFPTGTIITQSGHFRSFQGQPPYPSSPRPRGSRVPQDIKEVDQLHYNQLAAKIQV